MLLFDPSGALGPGDYLVSPVVGDWPFLTAPDGGRVALVTAPDGPRALAGRSGVVRVSSMEACALAGSVDATLAPPDGGLLSDGGASVTVSGSFSPASCP